MIIATVAGNVGKDAELRQAGGTTVCSFSVASSAKVKGQKTVTWIDVSIWGKRGESLQPFICKGGRVVVMGELTTREHQGKTYLQVRADQIELMGGGEGGTRQALPGIEAGSGVDADDDIPF